MSEINRADLHTHILPQMDDGPKSISASIELLKAFKEINILDIIATPHFYINENGAERFLERRSESYRLLKEAYNFDGRIILGAEVYYSKKLYRIDSFERLTLGNSSYILIELPYIPKIDKEWLEDIEDMMRMTGLVVVFAHIERFFDRLTWSAKKKLYSMDAVFQINLPSLEDENLRKKVYKFLKKKKFTVLASDSHNTESRSPARYENGWQILLRDIGEQAAFSLVENTRCIFDEIAGCTPQ